MGYGEEEGSFREWAADAAVGLACPFPRKETMLNWSSFLHKFIDILDLDVRLYEYWFKAFI